MNSPLTTMRLLGTWVALLSACWLIPISVVEMAATNSSDDTTSSLKASTIEVSTTAELVKNSKRDKRYEVMDLGDDDFAGVIADNEYVFVMFYATWCGHCHNLWPVIRLLSKNRAQEGLPIKVGKVDVDKMKQLARKYNIKSMPTLIFFSKNSTPVQYNGPRDYDKIVEWLKKRISTNIVN